MSDPNKVPQLPPTSSIQDPQTRAFCDALVNVWQLRNGNTGHDDSQRFITKSEWDKFANNPTLKTLVGLGQPGSSLPADGTTVTPTPFKPNPAAQALISLLNEPITLIDFANIRRSTNQLFATVNGTIQQFHDDLSAILARLATLENGYTSLFTQDGDTLSLITALTARVTSAETGLLLAQGNIADINDLTVTSGSINAQHTALVYGAVFDPTTGLAAAQAAILAINTIAVDSASASARTLFGMTVTVGTTQGDIIQLNTLAATSGSLNARTLFALSGRVDDAFGLITQINNLTINNSTVLGSTINSLIVGVGLRSRVFAQADPPPDFLPDGYALTDNDLWIDTDDGMKLYHWVRHSGWLPADDLRIAAAIGGVTNEVTARASADLVIAQALNTVWGYIGNSSQALVQTGSLITINPLAGAASNWTQVQAAVLDANGNSLVAALRQDFNGYVNAATGQATAAYTLRINVDAFGNHVVAGFGLYVDGQSNSSAFVIDASQFIVTDPANPSWAAAPFSVSNGITRMHATQIASYIISDNYGFKSSGWGIFSDGTAYFNNIYARGDITATNIVADTITANHIYSNGGFGGAGVLGNVASGSTGFSVGVPQGANVALITAYLGTRPIQVSTGGDSTIELEVPQSGSLNVNGVTINGAGTIVYTMNLAGVGTITASISATFPNTLTSDTNVVALILYR